MDLATSYESSGRYWENAKLIDTTDETASLLHLIARRGNRLWKNYLTNSSFENATITNSWDVTAGGTLNKDAADGLFGSASAELIPGAATEQMYQGITFLTDETISVGDIFNFSVWLKSAGAATGANNYIDISENDSGGTNDTTQETYTLAGGEGWVKYEVTHTITDSDSDRLVVQVSADAGDTINIDGAMLIRNDRSLNFFILNDNDGSSATSTADEAVEDNWDWFGFDTTTVDYIHPWRRMDKGTTVWKELQSLGDAIGAYYIGFDECGTLVAHGILEQNYSDPTCQSMLDETEIRNSLQVQLSPVSANKIIGHGDAIRKGTNLETVWMGTASDTWKDQETTGGYALNISVANGDYFPDADDYPEYWAQLGSTEDRTWNETIDIRPWDGWSDRVQPMDIFADVVRADQNHPLPAQHLGSDPTLPIVYMPPYPSYKRSGSKIIGLTNCAVIHKTATSGDGNGELTGVTRGNLVSGVDALSRPDEVRILLQNSTGSAKIIRDIMLIGKYVRLKTGEQGYRIESDDESDIAENGERVLEFGNSDILGDVLEGGTGVIQLNALHDYWTKFCKMNGHLYNLAQYGTPHWYFPADFHKLEIGGAGESEYIASMSQLTGIKISRSADGIGSCSLTFNEVQESWKADSNVKARYFATGKKAVSRNPGYCTVASQYYIGESDFRCTGADDDEVIQSAIDFINGCYGGGVVHLTKGTYIITTAIAMKSGVALEGEGAQTILEKNCND
ncbi:MAG: carbohydrate binding domain-containing protein, partial [Gammaproteobacteria bacterium]|nr:carbohydrate binding domain-containing protein [Gammaproteobacteria bacterium]